MLSTEQTDLLSCSACHACYRPIATGKSGPALPGLSCLWTRAYGPNLFLPSKPLWACLASTRRCPLPRRSPGDPADVPLVTLQMFYLPRYTKPLHPRLIPWMLVCGLVFTTAQVLEALASSLVSLDTGVSSNVHNLACRSMTMP